MQFFSSRSHDPKIYLGQGTSALYLAPRFGLILLPSVLRSAIRQAGIERSSITPLYSPLSLRGDEGGLGLASSPSYLRRLKPATILITDYALFPIQFDKAIRPV